MKSLLLCNSGDLGNVNFYSYRTLQQDFLYVLPVERKTESAFCRNCKHFCVLSGHVFSNPNSVCNLIIIRKMISYHQKHLQASGFLHYDAGNILLKASRPRLIQCLRQRSYAASCNENTVARVA